jgi:peptidoglycan hydrolase CwlO-like protein
MDHEANNHRIITIETKHMKSNIKSAKLVESADQPFTPPKVSARDQMWEVEEVQTVTRHVSLAHLEAQRNMIEEQIRQLQAQHDDINSQIDDLSARAADAEAAQSTP